MHMRTTRRKKKDGSVVTCHPLAHTSWNSEKRRAEAKIIHHFGRTDQIDRGAHVKSVVPALLMVRVAELETGTTWCRIHHELRALQATEFHTDSCRFFGRSQPSPGLHKLLDKLDVALPNKILRTEPLQVSLDLT